MMTTLPAFGIRSLGYRTDLIFPDHGGEILDRGDYLVIRTPSNPTFHWGNFLLFRAPPAPGDLARWTALFAREIGAAPTVEHMAFGWDAPDGATGEIQPFLDAGFNLEQNVVLAAREVVRPPKHNDEVAVRALHHDWEWEAALDNHIRAHRGDFEIEGFTRFARRKMAHYRTMADAGLGHWFGAFLGERLVADLGIFLSGEVGRFQAVGTDPDYRRRGICGALVYQAATYAFERMGVRDLVMVADEHEHAARIYQSVGFVPVERQVGMDRY